MKAWILPLLTALSVSAASSNNTHPPPGTVLGGPLPLLTNVIAISLKGNALGGGHTLALLSNGRVAAWGGANTKGQLNVPVDLTNAVAVAAGSYHSVALRADGTVVCWGRNDFGESSPPPDLTNVVAVTTSLTRTFALLEDGTVRSWGYLEGLSNLVSISAGTSHILGLRNDGTVFASSYGANQWGEATVPTDLREVAAISAAPRYSVALKSNGVIVAWGDLYYAPVTVSNVTLLSANINGGLAYRPGEPLFGWGREGTTYIANHQHTNITCLSQGDTYWVAVTLQPVIAEEPLSASVQAGREHRFKVHAGASTPMSFQWRHGDSPIPGATNSDLYFQYVRRADAGQYNVLVSCAGGSVTSTVATLTVTASRPKLVAAPTNQVVPFGSPATFSVTAAGWDPFTYQWQYNGVNIPNATTDTYIIPATSFIHTGSYSVIVRNQFATESSLPASLLVTGPPRVGLSLSGNLPVISLKGMWGSNFTVQHANSLPATNWVDLRTITNLTVESLSITDPLNLSPFRFYRAKMN